MIIVHRAAVDIDLLLPASAPLCASLSFATLLTGFAMQLVG